SVELKRTAGDFLSSLDFFSEIGLGMVEAQLPKLRNPLSARCMLYMVVELSSSADTFDIDALLQTALEGLLDQGVVSDAVLARSKAQQEEVWSLREEIPEAQRLGGPQLKHDIAVPASCLPVFMHVVQTELDEILPGGVVNAFGHLGDGNVHFNLSPPRQAADFSGKEALLSECVYRHAELAGGSFAAEHGLGRQKVSTADALRSSEERTMMRAIQRAFDPDAIMNSGCSV
ncbi:MAG: FAD-linked oxidase C-terminal domain-containing protein, partial [Mesorhizobium sp.]|nr:FAD-linked oxidase C-terminal domain-containing protein [Mesorhizobium sp.]